MKSPPPQAAVVGSGPNGLAAAITLARAGRRVTLFEARDTVGGGCRSAELTLPGFVHDVCSAIHPLAVSSPFFRRLPLARYGLEWIDPPAAVAHPLDDGTAAVLERSIDATVRTFDREFDATSYRRLMQPLSASYEQILVDLLGPLRPPRHPLAFVHFGLLALMPARAVARTCFRGERARALFAGLAAHAIQPLDHPATAAFGLLLGMLGHAVGWPLPRGGSQRISDALADYLHALGGEITTSNPVRSLADVPSDGPVLFDVTPRQLDAIVGDRFPDGYRQKLRGYRHGPGAYKVDWALDGPIPWRAAACSRAATVHVGGTLDEIAEAEAAVWRGDHPERPFVLLAQQSLFDPSRAPTGKHTAWAYCHVPNGSTVDMLDRIENQIERFAPGFRDRILARSILSPAGLEAYNENYVGGDIAGGVQDLRQLFTRPTARLVPYSTPAPDIFICSSSTPPGGGVHGMPGHHAARAALRRTLQEV